LRHLEYEVLKPFQHITGYKRPGDIAELSQEEAKGRTALGEVRPLPDGEITQRLEMIGETIDGFKAPPDYMLDKPKRRKKSEGEAGEG
jgi:hypothetical protein